PRESTRTPHEHSPLHHPTNATARRPHENANRFSFGQEWIEFAGSLEGVQIVAAAHVGLADEDLRHCPTAARFLLHLVAGAPVHEHVHLPDFRALLLKQCLGPDAVGTDWRCIDRDATHWFLGIIFLPIIWGFAADEQRAPESTPARTLRQRV